jgi:hypothetical protein
MMRSKRLISLALSLLLLSSVGFLWVHKWDVYDTLRLRNYQPSAEIEKLAIDTTMKDRARRLFYVYYPKLEDKATFNSSCSNSERTIVLGCYVSRQGIHLYNVTDPRLEGVIEVTSAHEMLHAAYERLGSSEKGNVNNLLNHAYDNVKDERIRQNIDDYRNNGANVSNELHSILGTEVRNLPQELEQYYARYFQNRLAVVEFSEKYEQAFTQRKEQVAAADKKLQTLQQQIDDVQHTLASQKETLNSSRAHLDSLLSSKQYEAYNNGVPGFNAQVNAYNTQVRYISQLIDQYNALVSQRNAIAVEEGELVKAIDSRPDTIEGE